MSRKKGPVECKHVCAEPGVIGNLLIMVHSLTARFDGLNFIFNCCALKTSILSGKVVEKEDCGVGSLHKL